MHAREGYSSPICLSVCHALILEITEPFFRYELTQKDDLRIFIVLFFFFFFFFFRLIFFFSIHVHEAVSST